MKTNPKSFLNLLTVGCILAVLLLPSAGSVRGDTEKNQQDNITGTWKVSIRYTGGNDHSTPALQGVSSPAKGRGLSSAPTNNVGQWINARFIAFRENAPPPVISASCSRRKERR